MNRFSNSFFGPLFLIFIVNFVSFSSEIWAKKIVDTTYKPISKKYYSGPYLIYNCAQKHWTCVDDTGFKLCRRERLAAIEGFQGGLACAPIERFPTVRSCIDRQQYFVDHPQSYTFCLHPARRI